MLPLPDLRPALRAPLLALLATLAAGCGPGDPSPPAAGDDDPGTTPPPPAVPPLLTLHDGTVTEGDEGSVQLGFDVTLSRPAEAPVTVHYSTRDGSATAPEDYTAIDGGRLVIARGQERARIEVEVAGDRRVEGDETFTLLLSGPEGARLASDRATGTIVDDDSAATPPALTLHEAAIDEGDDGRRPLRFEVTLSAPAAGEVSVGYATVEGSATPGEDFEAASGTLVIPAGQSSGWIEVFVLGDTAVEGDETFGLELADPVGASLAVGAAAGLIVNDDLPLLSIADGSIDEGDSGAGRWITLDVTLSEPVGHEVRVRYSTRDGSATAGSDFDAVAGRELVIPPFTTRAGATVLVRGDVAVEGDERFDVELSDPVGALVSAGRATVTIVDDDTAPPPSLTIADASLSEGDAGTTAVMRFAVTLSEAAGENVKVAFATRDGSATAGSDYEAASGSLVIPAGQLGGEIAVTIRGDSAYEGDETFTLELSVPNGATIADGLAVGTIVEDDPAPVSGLAERPANPDCIATDRPYTAAAIALERFTTITFSQPTVMRQIPGDDSRWYVGEKAGRVVTFPNDATASAFTVALDIRDRVNAGTSDWSELGFLGMAFDPDFRRTGHLYVSYTASGPRRSVISRFTSRDGGATFDPASEEVILTVRQPADNHNGGTIGFGPGPGSGKYLYIGFGDGGGASSRANAQDTENLLGAMVRIDVAVSDADRAAGVRYYIPPDNPFASSPGCGSGQGCPEIFAWGLRNPWAWSFDRETGQLWSGDVGERSWEEVNLVEAGKNYGWPILEGSGCFEATSCDSTGLTPPVVEYSRSGGNCAVIGGNVYRGSTLLGLRGRYILGDFCSGILWNFPASDPAPSLMELHSATPYSIAGFAEGNDGELYLLDHRGGGTIQRLVPAVGTGTGRPFPVRLSESGCVDPADPTRVSGGLIDYEINAPFWTDGVEKARYLSIPDGTGIGIDPLHDWDFPVGSVLLKHFRIDGRLIETRLLMRHDDGAWGGYSYEWNEAGSDALFVPDPKEKTIGTQRWLYPSPSQCIGCHTDAGGGPLGPETAQMNRNHRYAATGMVANQLATFEHVGLFDVPLADDPANLPALADPFDPAAPLEARARAYLHTNCAQCHQPAGPMSSIDLRYTTADADMNICDVTPVRGDLGISGARIVAPGDPDRSILLQRMMRRDRFGMPPFGSFIPDSAGAELLRQWIVAMDGACRVR